VNVSLALAPSKDRIVTIAAQGRARQDGFLAVGGADPESAAFRDEVRPRLLRLAAEGSLVVPVARTYPLEQAGEALAYLKGGHPGGKLALLP
jgi:NADPH:quinone reductase-like Zn-dependent oxidoreductase